jgi:hypothetical protein
MTVRICDNVIHLEGRCLVEDAEPLLLALQDHTGLAVDLENATRLHLAIVQILMAVRPAISGTSKDPIVARFLLQALAAG